MDHAMTAEREIPVPQESRIWRRVLGRAVWEGADTLLNEQELRVFGAILGVPLRKGLYRPILECWDTLRTTWSAAPEGPCSSRMFWKAPTLCPCISQITWMHECVEIRPRRIQYPPPLPMPLHLPCNSAPVVSDAALCCLPLRGLFSMSRTKTSPSSSAY